MDTFWTGCLSVWLTLAFGMAVAGSDDAVGVELGCGSGGAGPLQLAIHGHAVSTLRRLPCLCAVLADSELARCLARGEIGVCRNGPVILFDAEHPDGVDREASQPSGSLCPLPSALWFI